MSKHVIIGAGLGGLYEANRLINKGVKPENIVIIEKNKENHYTRPGHLNCSTFSLVTNNTGIQTDHSPAHHIKELERVMYHQLRRFNVEFIHEEFIGLQAKSETNEKGVITRRKDNSQGIYPADYVFDCTGNKALVAQAVNALQENKKPAFETTQLVDVNPIPDHLVAQVLIPDYYVLRDFLAADGQAVPPSIQQKTPQKNIEIREKLNALGWTYEAFPTFYKFSQGQKDKVCLYMETPPGLDKNQHRSWMQLLLDIYSNGKITDYTELKPSKKYGEKPRIVGFKSLPHVLNKVIHEADNLPVVVMGFDALKGFDYRLAHGVTSGVECCERMLKHLTIDDGSIQSIDASSVEKETFDYIKGTHKDNLTSMLDARQTAIANALEYFNEIYEKAANELPPSENIKKRQYQSIAGQLAYQASILSFSKLENRDGEAIASLLILNNCLGLLIRARTVMPANAVIEHHDINKKLEHVIYLLRTEINQFDIEQTITSGNARRLRNLFREIQANFQSLEGNFASHTVQNKAKVILTRIEQELTFSNSAPSGTPLALDLLSSDFGVLLQLLRILNPAQISLPQNPTSNFGFFNNSSVRRGPTFTSNNSFSFN
jgi:hypothetical protein